MVSEISSTSRRSDRLGRELKRLRSKRDLTQQEVVSALQDQHMLDERTLRRYERGNIPPRTTLILLVAKALKENRPEMVDRMLEMAEYAPLTPEEIAWYKLSPKDRIEHAKTPFMQTPEPQIVRWGPVDGRPVGISINGPDGQFIPWEDLENEIKHRLLNQVGRVIPPGCTVRVDQFHGWKEWLVRIVSPEGKALGYVWFGPDPEKNWAFDGLVRVGDAPTDYEATVWQVFQRYSDGSYRRIKANY